MEPDRNVNCLDGMCCPKCLSLSPFRITITATVTVTDDGTDDLEGTVWRNSSYCECARCGHYGTVKDFQLPLKERKRVERSAKKNLPLLIGQLKTVDGKEALNKRLKEESHGKETKAL